MLLCNLLDGINVLKSNAEKYSDIKYMATDHRKIKESYAFFAINGTKENGNSYISGAIENGASVIITDSEDACSKDIPYVLVDNIRRACAIMWSNFYNSPAKGIRTIAITGTNGKTSTAHYLYNIMRASGISCGLISTINWQANGEEIAFLESGENVSYAMTTPDPEVLYYLYNEMKEKNVKVVILEASSHALVQGRLERIDVEIGAFTNLSREHLDYHGTMEDYYLAKTILAKKSKAFIVNFDDNCGKRMKIEFARKVKCISFKEKADFYGENLGCNEQGCEYVFVTGERNFKIRTSLAGVHNAYNSMLASACACEFGIEEEAIQRGIEETRIIKGRCEKYKDKPIYIDYAHTPLAMETIIKAIKKLEPQKRVIALFGCGGQRDKGKRAEMAEISAKYADFTVITGDNPRNENPNEIISDILRGFGNSDEYIVIPSRKKAIEYACKSMRENDVLLLLGKGHEEYEISINGKEFFDERKILDEVMGNN